MKTITIITALLLIVAAISVAILVDAIPYLAMPASSTWTAVVTKSPNVYMIPATYGFATSYNTELVNFKIGPWYLIAHRITFIDNTDDIQVIGITIYEYDNNGNVTGSHTKPADKIIKPERMAMP